MHLKLQSSKYKKLLKGLSKQKNTVVKVLLLTYLQFIRYLIVKILFTNNKTKEIVKKYPTF